MLAHVSGLYRYPIKGLSCEPLPSVALQSGCGLPGDRAFALALPTTAFDEANPVALRKTEFLMLARQEALARLQTASYQSSELCEDHSACLRFGCVQKAASTGPNLTFPRHLRRAPSEGSKQTTSPPTWVLTAQVPPLIYDCLALHFSPITFV